MKILNAHIYWFTIPNSEHKSSTAEIEVPGLGIVNIKDFISDELRTRIEAEAIFALKQNLGIVCANGDDNDENPIKYILERKEDE